MTMHLSTQKNRVSACCDLSLLLALLKNVEHLYYAPPRSTIEKRCKRANEFDSSYYVSRAYYI